MKFMELFLKMFIVTLFIDGGEGGGASDAGTDDGGAGDATDSGSVENNTDNSDLSSNNDTVDSSTNDNPDGSGDELLLGKFKDVDALAESYTNLQKKLGNFQGAPKDGYAPIEGVEDTTADQNRLMAVLQEVGKDAQMDQATYEKLYTEITEMQTRVAEESLQEAIKSIPNYDTRAKAMQDTALRFLRPDQVEAVDTLMQTKESFEAVEVLLGQLRGAGGLPSNPGVAGMDEGELRRQIRELSPSDTATRAKLMAELNKRGDGEGRLV